VSLSILAMPVPVPAAGRVVLVYELHVANAGTRPLSASSVSTWSTVGRSSAQLATGGIRTGRTLTSM
jgi:hypothetical protein